MIRSWLQAIPAVLLLVCCVLAMAGCTGTRPKLEPTIVQREVAVPVAGGCVPQTLGQAPDLPGGNGPIPNGATGPQRYQNSLADRKLLLGRNKELETVVAGCPRAGK